MADPYSPYQGQPTQPGGYYPPPGQGGQPAYSPGPYGPPAGAPGYGPGGPGGPGYGPGGPGGPYGPGMPPPRKSGSTGVIIGLIAGVLALIVGVVIAIVLVFPDDDPTPGGTVPSAASSTGGGGVPQGNAPQASGEPKPSQFYEGQPISVYSKLANRSADADPATLDEVFGNAKRLPTYGPFQGIQVTLKDSRLDTDCASAAWGSGLQSSLRSADCTQLIRGVYVDDDSRYLGQIFILNLRDEQAAVSVQRSLDPDAGGDGFIKPLTSAPAQNFGQGYSEGRGEISGHWLVLSWVQYTDGSREKSFGDLIPMGVIVRNADNFIVKRNIGVR